jgi:alkanesulfonate monooxygenase SsuD/methylene tetrahydromethanopterin reductase-like flavin-dependent oxidoreductase (luciferase family)
MLIGIGLPSAIPGTPGGAVLDWARRAEVRGFSTLGTIDRIAYASYEPLIALAAAAGATSRVRLMTDILLGPTREPVVLAKAAASLAQLSGGRFTLGVGVGARPDDYAVVGRDFHSRGRDWDAALDLMDRTWRGDAPPGTGRAAVPVEGAGSRPRLVIGGTSEQAIARTVRWADGWTASGGIGDNLVPFVQRVRAAWHEAGRDGAPWISALTYFVVGDVPGLDAWILDYYGPDRGAATLAKLPRTPETLRGMVHRFEDAGVDEIVAFPAVAAADQVDRLADAVLS